MRDTNALAVARRALDLMLDTANVAAGDDPPQLVRAALIGALAKGWVVTGDARYRAAGRTLVRALARRLSNQASLTGDAVFADQQAFVVEHAMLAAAALGEPEEETRARAALDILLQRSYARGWGVRHTVGVAQSHSETAPPGLLQDQVQVASACLAAHQLTGEGRYLGIAIDLATILEQRYADPLTGLPNYVPLEQELRARLEAKQKFAALRADISRLEPFLRRYGVATGDTMLRALVQTLQSASVTVNIKSKEPIKNLYSPTHEIDIVEKEGWDVSATWKQENYTPKHPFVLYYQTAEEKVAASVVTATGVAVHAE